MLEKYAKDFETKGFTHEESLRLAKLAVHVCRINPGIGWNEIVDSITLIAGKSKE